MKDTFQSSVFTADMSQTLQEALIEALHDEYKARATYQLIINKFGNVRPFSNIVHAEDRHVNALLPLFEKYGFDIPPDDWASKITIPATLKEASEAGVAAEIENAEMYDRLLAATTQYPDVQRVLINLQRASQENHLPAFKRAANRFSDTDSHQMNPGKSQGHGRHGHGFRRRFYS